jgi:hypothetical protein
MPASAKIDSAWASLLFCRLPPSQGPRCLAFWHPWHVPQRSSRVLRRRRLTGATMPTSARACRPQRTSAGGNLGLTRSCNKRAITPGSLLVWAITRSYADEDQGSTPQPPAPQAPIAPCFSSTPVPMVWQRLARGSLSSPQGLSDVLGHIIRCRLVCCIVLLLE